MNVAAKVNSGPKRKYRLRANVRELALAHAKVEVRLEVATELDLLGRWPGAVARGIWLSALDRTLCTCSGRSGHQHEENCVAGWVTGEATGRLDGANYAIGLVRPEAKRLTFDVHLYGSAVAARTSVVAAIEALRRHGVGPRRAPVAGVEVVLGPVDTLRLQAPSPQAGCGRIAETALPGPPAALDPYWVRTTSPLAVEGLARASEPPRISARQVEWWAWRRLLGLAGFREPSGSDHAERAPRAVATFDAPPAIVDLTVVSGRTARRTPIVALTGSWRSATTAESAAALSSLLQGLSVGGRTTYGCGWLTVEPA